MKIKDLLEELKGADPEAEISFQMSDGCCGDTEDLGDPFIDVTLDTYKLDPSTGKKGWMKADPNEQSVRIILPAVKYMRSCIKSGLFKKLYDERFDADGKWKKETTLE